MSPKTDVSICGLCRHKSVKFDAVTGTYMCTDCGWIDKDRSSKAPAPEKV